MARNFTRASSHYLEYEGALVTAVPLTMACWFRSDSATVAQELMAIGRADSENHYFGMNAVGSVGGDPIWAITSSGGGPGQVQAATSTGYSANTWHHACGVWAAANDRRAYIDGGSKGTNASSSTPSGLTRTSIGRRTLLTPLHYMSGRIALPAIWNVALSDEEVAALARGLDPRTIRPESLVGGWELWGLNSPEPDFTGFGRHMIVNGPIAAPEPPGIVPFTVRSPLLPLIAR
jgi:hypothetical protein